MELDREPEVRELDDETLGGGVDEDVVRLHVLVDHAVRVRVLERLGERVEDGPQLVLGERPPHEPRAEGLPGEELHEDVGAPEDGAGPERLDDPGMPELERPLEEGRRAPLPEQLERELPRALAAGETLLARVALGEEDLPLPPLSELLEEGELGGEGELEGSEVHGSTFSPCPP